MKKIITLELKKAFANKLFFLAIIIGCLIAIYGVYTMANYYLGMIADDKSLGASLGYKFNPRIPSFILFNCWIGMTVFTMASTLFYLAAPLLAALPYCWSYGEEKYNGYCCAIMVRSGKKQYLYAKYIAIFASGGSAFVIPQLFSIFITAAFIPTMKPPTAYDMSYGIWGGTFLADTFYEHPFLYIAFFLIIDFIFGGLLACLSFTAASVIKYKVVLTLLPFVFLLSADYLIKLLYLVPGIKYIELSPYYFLRACPAQYPFSGFAMLMWIAALFLVTISVCLIRERKIDVC